MEESLSSTILEGKITRIKFGLATGQEICTSSVSGCPITHASQLSNPFLGLPLESGRCESCGTAEPGQCEGHFGYIELPIPIYHPDHVSELRRMLSMLCLKCLKMRTGKAQIKNIGILERALSTCCEEAAQISINEVKDEDGACYLELKVPARSRLKEGFWNFLQKYGFCHGDSYRRALLPSEVMAILKNIPEDSKRKLYGKGYSPQDGYILQFLPVPPNCLSAPDVSDGINVMSSDHSIAMLKKVLKQVEIIKSSRSGTPNFDSHQVEANDLQVAVAQYLQARGASKASRDVEARYRVSKEQNDSSTKTWLEKMKTLFIRKGSGFSSRSVITGDPYKGVSEIGLPLEIAQRITFEERVNQHNMKYLQKLVDEKLCLTYRDGLSTYSLREGSKGHTFLRPGQVVHRRIMDGDIVFINRPPTTHKHSLQALSVYLHEDHTVKINPLVCGPLSADFDGDCIHLFYPQSVAAKAEVLELFSVEKQLLSSHTGNFNLQMATDSLLSLKALFRNYLLSRAAAQQLAMFVQNSLPLPALLKAHNSGPHWTSMQILQTALPAHFDCLGDRHLISSSEILKMEFNRDVMQSIVNDIITSIFFGKGPNEVLRFFDSLQPMLMENLYSEGFSVGLEDFYIPRAMVDNIQTNIQDISPLLYQLRGAHNEFVELQLEGNLRCLKDPVTNFILKSSSMGNLIDSKSDSAISKVVQQVGFLGLQLSDKGKFYSQTLVGDMAFHFQKKYPFSTRYPSEEFGFVRSCLFYGLDPYQEMVHSISSREVIVRSSRGLTEPGTLFKNLMAILRDVVICYDGTVRNVCSNSIIQFEYGVKTGTNSQSISAAGEPVGVLAATAMSNPAYKAVLDSSPSSNSSWEMMKEILLCGVNFKNDIFDRRVILYLNDCDCGRTYCREKAAYLVKDQLKKVSLKDVAVEFLIEYRSEASDNSELDAGLVGHVHLNKIQVKDLSISMHDVLEKCQETISLFRKKKKGGHLFKRLVLSFSECCSFQHPSESKWLDMPCLKFFWQDISDQHLENTSHVLSDMVCPVLLNTIIKGDPRVSAANVVWISPDTKTWIRSPCKSENGELALDVVLEKDAVKQSGDAWRIVLDLCLPVIHLIDTGRSIPYAIKQIQELLGVSCAFEQAVQRLSTSVTMVTKGVLKEHLILLANSMTCAGNLIGFNMGGIKALSRSLNVQVPFTEATLFTPKKCFERAAEKCHADSLSSIVGACSWGKHVAVGTGSAFDILLDTREIELNNGGETDVYSFLHLVRKSCSDEDMDSGCLGGDNIELEDEDTELGLSPEHTSGFDRPCFEDSAMFEDDLNSQKLDGRSNESNWEKFPSSKQQSDVGWENGFTGKGNNADEVSEPSGWSSWGTKNVQKKDPPTSGGWQTVESHDVNKETGSRSAWERNDDQTHTKQSNGEKVSSSKEQSGVGWESGLSGEGNTVSEANALSNWGSKKVQKEDPPTSGGWQAVESHDVNKQSGSRSAWERNDVQTHIEQSNCEKVPSSKEQSGDVWESGLTREGNNAADNRVSDSEPRGWSSWGTEKIRKEDPPTSGGWQAVESQNLNKQSGSRSVWERKDGQTNLKQSNDVKVQSSKRGSGVGWENSVSGEGNNAADNKVPEPGGWSSWGSEKVKKEDPPTSGGWQAVESHDINNQSGSRSSWEKSDGQTHLKQSNWEKVPSSKHGSGVGWENAVSGEGNNAADNRVSEPGGWSNWGSEKVRKEDSPTSGAWNAVESQNFNKQSGSRSSWERKDDQPHEDRRVEEDSSRPAGWTSAGSSKWGQQKRFTAKGDATQNSRGWGSSNAGDQKSWRNRPPKSVGGHNDDSGAGAAFTATRQRLDIFTAEEKDILLDVEPIIHSIRKIQASYNDGDPFSAEDQSYVLDNVFNYHPDKALKAGAAIDYVMVSKHMNFQESRCFYIVSTDGRKEDFSYRKCLENFIKGKYPDLAESFIAKYFKKNQPRPNWTRERSVAATPEEDTPDNRE